MLKQILNMFVLNLIINGIPSIPGIASEVIKEFDSFKPYYKWNTFNTYLSSSLLDS